MLSQYLYSPPSVPERLANRLPILSTTESKVKMSGHISNLVSALEKCGAKYQTTSTDRDHACGAADLDPLAMELEMMADNLKKMEAFSIRKAYHI